jgi:hypothetical protein
MLDYPYQIYGSVRAATPLQSRALFLLGKTMKFVALDLNLFRRLSRAYAAMVCAAAIAFATGCATQTQRSGDVVANAACDGINTLPDSAAGARLDMAPSMLAKIRELAKTDNAGVCAMPTEQRAKVMLAHRSSLRNPDRKTFRSTEKEFIKNWDRDEYGRLPTAESVLGADRARRGLFLDATSSKAKAAGISASRWEFIGPGNIGGRIRAMLIDPRNSNRLIVGSASGGIWISENAGASYRAANDFLGNLAIGSLAFDPNNPNVIYAGTGEFSSGLLGIGIFKSSDGGNSWNFLPSASSSVSTDWSFTNRIAVSQADSNLVLAATWNGLYRSENAGASWVKVPSLAMRVLDVQFDPNNADNVVAGGDDGFMYFSRDAGASWTKTAALVTTLTGRGDGTRKTARAEIAFAKSTPNLVYISLDNNKGDVWKSEDAGATWAFVSNPKHLNEQGDYDNAIWVSPIDSSHVLVGGLDLHRSIDGGTNFTKISDWRTAGTGLPQPHADHHVIVSGPNYSAATPVVYFGNDGGVFRSNDIFSAGSSGTSSWVNLVNNLGVTQFYGGAGSRAAGGKIIGGTQDNGAVQLFSGTDWFRTAGGDGGFAAVDPVDDTTIYGEYVYASIHRRIGDSTRQFICAGISEALKNIDNSIYCGANNPGLDAPEANFIAPFILDPNNRNRMLVGANSLWISNNVKNAVPTWAAIKPPVAAATSRLFINAVAVYQRDSNIIWTGHNQGQVWKTTDGLAGSPNWTRVGAGVLPNSTVNRVTIDPDNANRVWVSYSGFSANRIWQTDDGGATWRSISTTLPAVTVHDLKRHPTQPNWLYAATANGVYTSEDGGASWNTTNDGPASVRVRELFFYDPSTLIAATYGRGMWRIKVDGAGPADYSDVWWAGQAENGWGMAINQKNQTQFITFYVYDAAGKPIWYAMTGGTWNANFTSYSGALYSPTSSPFSAYNAAAFNPGPPVGNATVTYTSNSTATLQYVINGQAGQKAMQRLQFGPVDNTPGLKVGDMWWGGTSQNGWGISITQQFRTLFGAWYTYDASGKVTWYTLSGGTWNGNTYSGTLYTAQSAPWLGVPYNAAAFSAIPVGSLSLSFMDANNANMTYTVNGITQTKPITRLAF